MWRSHKRCNLSVESREIYSGLPFTLAVTADQFDEAPEPTITDFEIPGCRVTYLGVSPQVSSFSIQINGRVQQSKDVSFVYRYRVEAPRAGSYKIPPITVEQGDKSASSGPQSFRAAEIEATSDMRLAVVLPERPVWVGETFEVSIDWFPAQPAAQRELFCAAVHPRIL